MTSTTMLTFLLPEEQLDHYESMALDNLQGLDYSRNASKKHREDRSARFCTHVIIKPVEGSGIVLGFGCYYVIVELWTHKTDLMSLAYFLRQYYAPDQWHFVDYTPYNY